MATALYLRTTAASTSRGQNDVALLAGTDAASAWSAKLLSPTISTAANTEVSVASETGASSGIEPPGTAPILEWISEPLAAGVTISSTVTFNIAAYESNNKANATVRVIVERLDKTLTVQSTIVDSQRGQELGTKLARETWTASPTSTAMGKGERLRVRVAFDDATAVTMASGYTLTMAYNGTNANLGDANVTFTESLTFMTAASDTVTLSSVGGNRKGAVACSSNRRVVVSGNRDAGAESGGRAYVRYGADLGSLVTLVSSDIAAGDAFGGAVACSSDGATVVVGAYSEDGAGTDRGKVYIYNGASWGTETKTLTASDADNNAFFGDQVACSSSGAVIVVGSPQHPNGGSYRGKAYVYSGANWTTETILTPPSGTDDANFGTSVACSADGSVVVVGEAGAGYTTGRVYVFSGSSWGTRTTITASDAAANDYFGFAVACSSDGATVVVGAYSEDGAGSNRGKVYIYNGASWGTETKTLTASDAADNDYFGCSVACSSDGATVVVGAYSEDGAGTDRGKVYAYSGTNWGTETTYVETDPGNSASLGVCIAAGSDGRPVAGTLTLKVSVWQWPNVLYLTNTASDIADQGTTELKAWTSRGTG